MELNQRQQRYQHCALPTELLEHMEQKVRVELTNERVAASYSADECLPHFQGLRVVTVYISLCPVYSSIITNLLIMDTCGILSLISHLLKNLQNRPFGGESGIRTQEGVTLVTLAV